MNFRTTFVHEIDIIYKSLRMPIYSSDIAHYSERKEWHEVYVKQLRSVISMGLRPIRSMTRKTLLSLMDMIVTAYFLL